uniref:Uncharacterized protein n=1 Tax=Vespula pensylvanica TaxID=30213 RepID=A0A834P2R7_VESPE|nr:hypothetical protein H0235_008251 [Vespula pensylvanica]
MPPTTTTMTTTTTTTAGRRTGFTPGDRNGPIGNTTDNESTRVGRLTISRRSSPGDDDDEYDDDEEDEEDQDEDLLRVIAIVKRDRAWIRSDHCQVTPRKLNLEFDMLSSVKKGKTCS